MLDFKENTLLFSNIQNIIFLTNFAKYVEIITEFELNLIYG